MTTPAAFDFANQNLCDRNFTRQNLNGSNFSGADLRGCRFDHSQLVEADFRGAKVGLSLGQIGRLSALGLGLIGIMGDCLTRLIFGALGQTPATSAWSLVLLLMAVLMTAGGASAASVMGLGGQGSGRLSGLLAGALVGFFYGGRLTANSTGAALLGLVLGGVAIGLVQHQVRRPAMTLATTTAALMMTDGATFMLSANASAALSTDQGWLGSGLGILTIGYWGITLLGIQQIWGAAQQLVGTSFRGANLTAANFADTPCQNADFSHTIGYNRP
jgi:hypothetical protein